jgi:hypothetical protein
MLSVNGRTSWHHIHKNDSITIQKAVTTTFPAEEAVLNFFFLGD